MSDTVTVRGTGGAEWAQDIPEPGSIARAQWDKDVADGRLVIIAGDAPQELGAGPDTGEKSDESDPAPAQADTVPDGPIDAVVAWVQSDAERARAALSAEAAKAKPRKSLLDHLAGLLNIGGDDDTAGDTADETDPATPATPEA